MARSHGPAPEVGTLHCLRDPLSGSYTPMAFVTGIVNHTRPSRATATKSGCPNPAGSCTTVVKVWVRGSNSPNVPGGVVDGQLGARSQPGMATHTWPRASNAVPHGNVPGTG